MSKPNYIHLNTKQFKTPISNNQKKQQQKQNTKAKAIITAKSSTMAKAEDKGRRNRSSGIRPFTYTKEEWPTDQKTETVTSGTGKSGGKVSNK